MRKRIFSLLVAFAMCLSLIPGVAWAVGDDASDTLGQTAEKQEASVADKATEETVLDAKTDEAENSASVIRGEGNTILYGNQEYRIEDGQIYCNDAALNFGEGIPYKIALADNTVYAIVGEKEQWVVLDDSLAGEVSLLGNSDNEREIFLFTQTALGVNTAATCGILANIYAESSFRPTAYVIDTNGLPSYGICQWNGGRYTALQNYCSQNGYDYTTLSGQLQYLKYELTGSESSAFNKVISVPDTAQGAYDAGYNWARYFERCASRYYTARAERARDVYWSEYSTSQAVLLSGNAQTLIDYLNNRADNNETYPKGLCQAFVWESIHDCFQRSNTKQACCAAKAWQSYGVSELRDNIPLGAAVYFAGGSVRDSSCGQIAGHVGLHVGDGYIVHAWSGKIVRTTIDYVLRCGYSYRGWGWQADLVLDSTPPGESTLSISGEVYPTGRLNPGQGFGLRGDISSNYKLTDVSAWVFDASGNIVMEYHHNPDSYHYNIRTDGLNDAFVFNNLSVGYYSYAVDASDSSGMTRTLISNEDSRFQIGDPTPHTTHEKGAYQWYEDAHPHYHYWKCSVCGELFTDGSTAYVDTCPDCIGPHTHEKGEYQWYEDAHPHYHYWKCSICGELFTDGSTAHVDTCPDCVEPGKPSLTGMKSVYASGEAIILRWGDTVNTTHINLYFDKKNDAGEYERVYTVHYAENGLSETFDTGEYRVLIQSTNSNSWLPDGSTWRYTNGDWVSFTVNPPIPSAPWMSVNKESVIMEEEITFTYGATDATGYYIGIDRDGSRILSQNVPASGFTMSFSEAGQYSAYVSCSNVSGFVDSNRVSFTVNLPKYHLDVNGYLDGASAGSLGDYGTVDVYINGSRIADDVTDYYEELQSGTNYEIKDIKPKAGYSYNGVHGGVRSGVLSSNHAVVLDFSAIQDIEENPERTSFNGHTYLAFNTPVTWYAAKWICENRGGHLATITSAEENAFVRSIITGEFWIGGTDADDEQHWRWVTQEAFSYENWRSGQPDNSISYEVSLTHTGEENHLRVYEDGTWNDISGCLQYPFICEIDDAEVEIMIANKSASRGATVEIPVTIKNNPGISGATLAVSYDKSVLTLTSVTKGAVFENGSYAAYPETGVVQWYHTENVTGDGVLFTLQFAVNGNAQNGSYNIAVGLRDGIPANLSNADSNVVNAQFISGVLEIASGIRGDVTGDGVVAINDVVKVARAVAGNLTLTEAETTMADVTGDGVIAINDVVKLARYVAGNLASLQSAEATSLSGGESAVIEVATVSGKPGEIVRVPVSVISNPGIAGAQLDVLFDSGLTLKNIVQGDVLSAGTFNPDISAGRIQWYYDQANVTNTGVLFTLEFEISANAKNGDAYAVTVNVKDGITANLSDYDFNPVNAEFKAGKVQVGDASGNAVISTVSRNGNTVTANVVCSDSNASVFCGVYNNSGKMIAVRSVQVTSESTYQFQFDGQQFDYAKAFVVDSDFRPLCEGKRT